MLQSPHREWGLLPCSSRLFEIVCPIPWCKQVGFYAGIVQTVMLESKASQGVWGLLFSMLAWYSGTRNQTELALSINMKLFGHPLFTLILWVRQMPSVKQKHWEQTARKPLHAYDRDLVWKFKTKSPGNNTSIRWYMDSLSQQHIPSATSLQNTMFGFKVPFQWKVLHWYVPRVVPFTLWNDSHWEWHWKLSQSTPDSPSRWGGRSPVLSHEAEHSLDAQTPTEAAAAWEGTKHKGGEQHPCSLQPTGGKNVQAESRAREIRGSGEKSVSINLRKWDFRKYIQPHTELMSTAQLMLSNLPFTWAFSHCHHQHSCERGSTCHFLLTPRQNTGVWVAAVLPSTKTFSANWCKGTYLQPQRLSMEGTRK